MSSAGITKQKDAFTQSMTDAIKRASGAKGGFARIYALYQKFQVQRFMTQNASEGSPWDDLSPTYAESKRRMYGGGVRRRSRNREGGTWNTYPGSGTKMMIATGALAGAAVGPGGPFAGTENHRAMFSDREMIITVEQSGTNPEGKPFTYPSRANERRPFMGFSHAHIEQMKDELKKFVFGF